MRARCDAVTFETGVWTLRFMAATLLIAPLRRWTGWNVLIKYRRMLGLYAFFYGCLHFTTYIWLDQFFDWPGMVKDIAKRPFITIGFAAFVLMIPLAAFGVLPASFAAGAMMASSLTVVLNALRLRRWRATTLP